MAHIELRNASLDFPIYNARTRSIKNRLIQVATGGQISEDSKGRVIVKALTNINLDINDGERVGIIGHNGSGKSTLLRMLSKVYTPTFGTAKITGRIGSLIDISLGIDPEATGRENIFLRGALLGLSRDILSAKSEDIIEFSEIGNFIDMPVRTYSSGMHLRLAFAISTEVRPEILIMDEWLSVGDEGFKQKAKERMYELVESTSILVIATHSAELISEVCSRVIWLEHGAVKMDGHPSAVLPNYFAHEMKA